jgi:hypothetical protein
VRQHGNSEVGTTYLNTSTSLGRNTRPTYVVDEFIDRQLIRLRGQNKTVMAVDTMTFQTLDLYGHLFGDRLDEVADALDVAARAAGVSPRCCSGS